MTETAEAAPIETVQQPIKKLSIIPQKRPRTRNRLTGILEISPNDGVAVIYRKGTKIPDILSSLEVIVADLKHRAKTEEVQ